MTVRLACVFDVSFFPFDKHLCYIDVGAWLLTNESYKIRFLFKFSFMICLLIVPIIENGAKFCIPVFFFVLFSTYN